MFRFEIRLTDDDFLDFNRFHMFSTDHQGKQVQSLRFLSSGMMILIWLMTSFSDDFTWGIFIARGIVYVAFALLAFFGTKPFMWAVAKRTVKKSLASDDRLFSREAIIEFSEEGFFETTPVNRTENKYDLIKSIYLVNGRMFYIYINSMQGYILPVAAFDSAAQYNSFIDFIRRKTGKEIIIKNEKR